MYYNLLFVGLTSKLEIPEEGNDVLNAFCYLMYFLIFVQSLPCHNLPEGDFNMLVRLAQPS